jgi:hypothetical protein
MVSRSDRRGERRSSATRPQRRPATNPIGRWLSALLILDRGPDRLRDTIRAWRVLSAILILGAAGFEAFREQSVTIILVAVPLAIAYWAVLPWLVRFAARRHGRRPDRPV